jgi:hypothetical protein
MGLENANVEDVDAEKRQENDTMSELSQSVKTLEVDTEEEFFRNTGRQIRTVKEPVWMTSGDYYSLGTHCYCWWRGSNVILRSYELRA